MKKQLLSVCVAYTMLVIVVSGSFLYYLYTHHHDCTQRYVYVNPDIVCDDNDVIVKTSYRVLRDQLETYIDERRAAGQVDQVSVYFRDLVHGPIMGIDEHAAFAPASLLKVPLAFVFLNAAETQPVLLTHTLTYAGTSTVSEQRIAPQEFARPDTVYTIEELLRMMIVYSDNASYEALEAFIRKEPARQNIRFEVFQEIGIIDPRDRGEDTLTVRGYAGLFRLLYNVSYLNEEYANLLLQWLADATYDAGLRAGVPDIAVASKFGERILTDGTKQLHECGIVYFPDNPYLLCVMTRGSDWDALTTTIRDVSRMVWDEVESRRI